MLQPNQLPDFFLKSFLESPVPTIVANEETFLFTNHAFCDCFGYDSNKMAQLNFDLITPNNVIEIPHQDYFLNNPTLKHFVSERYIQKENGQVVLIELSWVRHQFELDPYIIFFIRDITLHKTKNEKLYENEKRLSLALKACKQSVWDWNNITDETFYSDDYFIMLGYVPNEFEPSYEKWVSLLHPEDVDYATFAQQLYMESKTDHYEIDFRLQKKDKTYIWTHTRAVILTRDAHGNPERIIGIVVNIDEQKKKEKLIQELTQKLIEFAFYHSHILRSPVARALGLVQLMKYEENPLYFELVEKSIHEINEIIIKMNDTLINDTKRIREKSLASKKLTFVAADKLSQFVYKKILAKFNTNFIATFHDNLYDFVNQNVKEDLEHIVVLDIQIVPSSLWEQIEQVQLQQKGTSLFLLTDFMSVDTILKAKSYAVIKGILLKPLTFKNINHFFS